MQCTYQLIKLTSVGVLTSDTIHSLVAVSLISDAIITKFNHTGDILKWKDELRVYEVATMSQNRSRNLNFYYDYHVRSHDTHFYHRIADALFHHVT